MVELFLVGIGTGNPEHITIQAKRAIAEAGIILIPYKGSEKSELVDVRLKICKEIIRGKKTKIVQFDLPSRDLSCSYQEGVEKWHDNVASVWSSTIRKNCSEDTKVAFLIWGDPSLYDSSLRIAERLKPTPKIHVFAGITSIQALTAAHKIPINEVGQPFIVTTGRNLFECGFPQGVKTVAVMLDGKCSFQSLREPKLYIYWGAYLGMENEIILEGWVEDVSKKIMEIRADARNQNGWIMDSYILQKR
ncbi:precorrin-6A synthase (deacetylating) [bacterium]|nr:precorrin-6A synthase (deacetylating) [bacterium]